MQYTSTNSQKNIKISMHTKHKHTQTKKASDTHEITKTYLFNLLAWRLWIMHKLLCTNIKISMNAKTRASANKKGLNTHKNMYTNKNPNIHWIGKKTWRTWKGLNLYTYSNIRNTYSTNIRKSHEHTDIHKNKGLKKDNH